MQKRIFSMMVLAASLWACGTGDDQQQAGDGSASSPEAYSLDGTPLYPLTFDAERQAELERNLAEAQAAFDADPDDPENIIWLGRRTAYLGRYNEAIKIYTAGLQLHPENYKLLRHRGHRHISIRKFKQAIADLEVACQLIEGVPDEVEPDGQPNKFNIPTSTSHSNIWYHLGLAYYLDGDFESAVRAYRECLKFSKNPDMLVATSDWLYMSLRRLDRTEEAQTVLEPIHADMEILENHAYHDRLLMYKGMKTPEELLDLEKDDDLQMATYGYGIGNWYLYNGEVEKANAIFKRVLAASYWPAFGYIAAEADLHRLGVE